MTPAKWPEVSLGKVCTLVRGVTFDASQVSRTPASGMVPVLRAGNISDSLNTVTDLVWVPQAIVGKDQRLRLNDIVMCLSSGSSNVVGKSARLEHPFDGTAGAFCGILRPHSVEDSLWLAYWLQSPAFAQWRSRMARGSNIQNLRVTEIARLQVPYPSVETRQAVLGRTREAMDHAKAALAGMEAQWRAANALAAAILTEAFRDNTPIRAQANVVSPAPGWQWKAITDVARLESGHTPSRRHPEWWGGDVPWIALPDIRALDGKLSFNTAEYTNKLGIANSSARVLPTHTVVMSRTASVGFVTLMGRPMATSQDFVNWVCGPELDPFFLAYALRASREYIRGLASGAVHKTIYMPTLHSLQVCMPPIQDQRRIVSELDAKLAEADRLRSALMARRVQVEKLPSAILRNAFTPATSMPEILPELAHA